MATLPQITANRANAQLSTGPATPQGIAASKHNATKHGLTGKQIVIKGEDPAEYDALRASLVSQHAPASELEAMLVEQIAQHWWRLERARRIESRMFNEFGELEAYSNKAYLNLARQMNSTERAWDRAVKDLARLKEIRARIEEMKMIAEIKRSAIGSVFANRPTPPAAAPAQPANPVDTAGRPDTARPPQAK